MTVKTELLAIKGKKTKLFPKDVVAWAREHPTSDLHDKFEWDDTLAADQYRLVQARQIIQLHIVTETGDPVMVSLRFERPHGGGYRMISDVAKEEDLLAMMLRDALADLRRVRERYKRVSALAKVWTAIEAAEEEHAEIAKAPMKKSA